MTTNVLSTDPNSPDFMKIDPTSVLAGAGVGVGIATDYADAAFASPPSIGALEVSSGVGSVLYILRPASMF